MGIQSHFTMSLTRIRHTTSGPDTVGGWSSTDEEATIMGVIGAGRGRLALSAGQITHDATHKMYCGAQEDVQVHDTIQDPRGQKYRVIHVGDPMGRGHHLEVDLEMIAHGTV